MSRTAITIRKYTLLIHRWMGVFFCVLFLSWFASGFVMMYCDFPSVGEQDRLAHAAPLNPDQIRISPDRALASLHTSLTPTQLRLNVLDGRPVYRFTFDGRPSLVYADNAEHIGTIPHDAALRIASQWTGFAPSRASSQPLLTAGDQWTVYSSIHPYGPFWKFSWPGGEEVYVSQVTGEVVQDTTPHSRIGAYFGAIPHWLYFRWLAGNASLWSRVVIVLAATGSLVSLLGIVSGLWLYLPSKRIPFAGVKRWHVVLGLIFGSVTFTWVFSGLLSMGPFPWLNHPDQPAIEHALWPGRVDVAKFGGKSPAAAIADSGLNVRELEFASFGSQVFYVATETPHKSRIVHPDGLSEDALDTSRIVAAVKEAAGLSAIEQTRLVKKYEPYYVDRQNRQPLPVLYVQLNGPDPSAYYIDPRTGKLVQSYETRSRWNRWLYHGLHSLDLPWLYAHRPAWDIVVMLLLAGGFSLSLTSLSIALLLLRKKLRRVFFSAGFPPAAPTRLRRLR